MLIVVAIVAGAALTIIACNKIRETDLRFGQRDSHPCMAGAHGGRPEQSGLSLGRTSSGQHPLRPAARADVSLAVRHPPESAPAARAGSSHR